MNLNKLYEIKNKLEKLSKLINKKKYSKFYLTNEDKIELLKQGKRIPLRVKDNGRDVKIFAKTKGTIESGELKNKRMRL